MATDFTLLDLQHFMGGANLTDANGDDRDLASLLNAIYELLNTVETTATADDIVQRNAAGDVLVPLVPSTDDAAASKAYVLSSVHGLDPKDSVRAATAAAGLVHSGPQTVDGIACVAGDRVLDKDNATGTLRGIWIVAAGAWTRATDMALGMGVAGAYLQAEEGGVAANHFFCCTNNKGTDVVGTDTLTFVDWGAIIETDLESYTCDAAVAVGMAVYCDAVGHAAKADASDPAKMVAVSIVFRKPTTTTCLTTKVKTLSASSVGIGKHYVSAVTPGTLTLTPPSTVGHIVQCVGYSAGAAGQPLVVQVGQAFKL